MARPRADDEATPSGRDFAVVLARPNLAVAVVWVATVIDESLLHSRKAGLVSLPTLFCGWPYSAFGGSVAIAMVVRPDGTYRGWWLGCLAANAVGAAINFVAFVVFVAPAC